MDVKVYYAKMPAKTDAAPLSSPERAREIQEVKSEKAKREKYFVWRLLEYALFHAYGLQAKDLRFSQSESGKWLCDACEFSLSHSKDGVAVALAKSPVGVDIQAVTPPSLSVVKRVLNEREQEALLRLSDGEKPLFFAKAWTEKESVFKALNQSGFFSAQGREGLQTATTFVTLDGVSYALTVATENTEKVSFFHAEVF